MAVLIEAISVVIRRASIDDRYIGGWEAFERHVPNATLCTDGRLARVGFMGPPDAQAFIAELAGNGLRFLVDGVATDLAVVDQQEGPLHPCRWLAFGRLQLERGGTVAMCWLEDGNDGSDGTERQAAAPGALAAPPGWEYEGSLSQQFQFIPSEQVEHRLQLLRRDDHGQDVYLDLDTGREIYIARTSGEERSEEHP
jgi:hypothetical protein